MRNNCITINISDLDENKEYKLRVYGKGKGIVTVQHGEEIENISFDTNYFTEKEHTLYFNVPSFVPEIQSEDEAFTMDGVEFMEGSDDE